MLPATTAERPAKLAGRGWAWGNGPEPSSTARGDAELRGTFSGVSRPLPTRLSQRACSRRVLIANTFRSIKNCPAITQEKKIRFGEAH